jgi:RNA polymerase sigma-70 factor (ECF subfamily)
MQRSVPDEATIVAYLQQDDAGAEKAMSWVIDAYGRSLYSSIKRWTNSGELTNDILQDVFVLVWRHRLSFKGNSSFFSWLYRIAYNETLQTLKKEKKHFAKSLDLSPEEISNLLLEAISTLPEKQRLVFEMKYFEDMKYEDIAAVTGGSVGGLKANYFHATQKIEQYLLSKLNH